MAQKQVDERLEANEKNMREMKEMITNLTKVVEGFAVDLRETKRELQSYVVTKSATQSSKGKEKVGEQSTAEMNEDDDDEEITPHTGERLKFKRLEMPVFNGEHPDSWVYRAETYFEMHYLTEREKVKVSVISFEPDIVDWFCWANKRRRIKSWEELKSRLFSRFRPPQEGTLMARFLALKQDGTVAEFRKKFEIYSAPIPHVAEDVLENSFLNGLKPQIRADVLSRRPIGLEEIMEEAQLVEDRNIAISLSEEINGSGQNYGLLNKGAQMKTHTTATYKSPTKGNEAHQVRNVTLPDKGYGFKK